MVLPLWTYLADVPRNPASTMKLVTTYAALELLGSQYRWNTVIASSAKVRHGVLKGNLYIKGSGDPKLSTDQFFEILSLLRAKGIKDIEGDIVLDRSWFIHPEVAAFNMTPEAAYQVLPDALLLNHQLLEVKAESDQKTVTLTLDPALPALTVKNNLVVDQTLFCANENIPRPLFIETLEGQLMIRFRGRFPAHCQKTRYYQVLDVERYINSLFTSLWQDLGGKWSGQIRLGKMPRRVKPLYVHYSPTLEKVLLDINKWSNNPMTRLVYLRLGQKQYASLA